MSTGNIFIKKLFNLVNDPNTNNIISWDSNGQNFSVHDLPRFTTLVLPNYFKHNNFSSFVRQLNHYGFHKMDPDKWIFGHPEFREFEEFRIKNIRRVRGIIRVEKKKSLANDVGFILKLSSEIDSLKRYRDMLNMNIQDVYKIQNGLEKKLELIEIKQNKTEVELNKLKSFVFGYFSQLLSKSKGSEDLKKLRISIPKDVNHKKTNPRKGLSRLSICLENFNN